jgi:SAM-dependent methyltransferase
MWLAVFGFQWWVERVNSAPPHRIPKNAPFIPSPQDVVDRMLELAELDENDVVYDLGCGDGRIVITAAKRYGCRGIGFEYDAKIAELARENVRRQGVADLVTIEQRDIFTIETEELNRASAITLYLLPWMNDKLKPQLVQLGPGKVIVSHEWDLPGYEPDRAVRMESQDDRSDSQHRIFLWRTPLKKK